MVFFVPRGNPPCEASLLTEFHRTCCTISPPPRLHAGLVLDAILQCDVDARKELYAGVVLTGGTSLISGLRDRLEREIIAGGPQAAKVKVSMPINTQERRFSVWIGGSRNVQQ